MVSWCQIQFLEYYVQTGSSMKEANLSKTYTCHIFTKHLQHEDQIPQKKISCNNVILWQTGGEYFPVWTLDLSTYVMCATLCNIQVSIATVAKKLQSLCPRNSATDRVLLTNLKSYSTFRSQERTDGLCDLQVSCESFWVRKRTRCFLHFQPVFLTNMLMLWAVSFQIPIKVALDVGNCSGRSLR